MNKPSMSNSKERDAVLIVRNLSKFYASKKVVDQVSFSVCRGECFGLLGTNGAGKTTTIEIIEGITLADSGEVIFKQRTLDISSLEYFGIQLQDSALPPNLTVEECIKTFQDLYKRSLSLYKILDLCELHDFKHQLHNDISGGQRQRLLLAISLCNDPELLLLDEPTTGLDPQSRRHLWEVIKKLKKNGKSIILTTHYMEEATELCDHIAIMNHGKIIATGNPQELIEKHFSNIAITVPDSPGVKLASILSKEDFLQRSDKIIYVHTSKIIVVLQKLINSGIPLQKLKIRSSNLEDLFFKLTERVGSHEF